MTDEQYRARIACIEMNANWSIQWNRSQEGSQHWADTEAVMRYCSACVEADFYLVPRPEPETDDPWLIAQCYRAINLFERMWLSPGPVKF